jgi:hypothetical protein
MNTYIFELEFPDGDTMTYETCGVNFIMANDMLIEYLKSGGIDPHDVAVTNLEVIVYEEGEDE